MWSYCFVKPFGRTLCSSTNLCLTQSNSIPRFIPNRMYAQTLHKAQEVFTPALFTRVSRQKLPKQITCISLRILICMTSLQQETQQSTMMPRNMNAPFIEWKHQGTRQCVQYDSIYTKDTKGKTMGLDLAALEDGIVTGGGNEAGCGTCSLLSPGLGASYTCLLIYTPVKTHQVVHLSDMPLLQVRYTSERSLLKNMNPHVRFKKHFSK